MKNRSNCTRSLALLSLLAALLATSSLAFAEQDKEVLNKQDLAPPLLVVTATRLEQPLAEALADITVIERPQIEAAGTMGLADFLSRVPGVTFSQSGGPGTVTSLFLRGGEQRFTAVYIDGVRVDTQSTSGGTTWNAIPLAQVERIEVLRGPAAAVYGSDAVSGVVAITTKRGQKGFNPRIQLSGGSYGTRRLDISLSGREKYFDYAWGLTQENSDGFNAQPAANPDRDGYRSTATSARLGWEVAPDQRLEMTWLGNDLNADFDGYASTSDDITATRLQVFGISWRAHWSDTYSSRLSLGRSEDDSQSTSSGFTYGRKTTVMNYLWLNEWKLKLGQVTAVLEQRDDTLSTLGASASPFTRSQKAAALGYGTELGSHRFQANARYDQDSDFGGQSTGSLAYGYAFTSHWLLRFVGATAFRAPTLYQLFSEYGVAGLKPEEAVNGEGTLKYETTATRLSLTFYHRQMKNLVSYVNGPGACSSKYGCYVNTARARYQGITLEGEQRFGGFAPTRLQASLDLQDNEDLDSNKRLARRPEYLGRLGVESELAGWTLRGELKVEGERYDDAANLNKLSGFTLFNLGVSTRLAKEWHLDARINNLGDTSYQTAKGYATAGRSFFVGLAWQPR